MASIYRHLIYAQVFKQKIKALIKALSWLGRVSITLYLF